MYAEQAIFTSIARRGKAGYHLVAKSQGLTIGEAAAIEAWSPSHGALQTDAANRASVNFQQLLSGRYALSRTIEGKAEYSGRGGRQLYTQFLIFDGDLLRQTGFQPFAVYRDALAQGCFFFQRDPPSEMDRIDLASLHVREEPEHWEWLVREFGRARFESLICQLEAERPVVLPYSGDRNVLAEALLNRLEPEKVQRLSFTTSLQPSTVRPVTLQLVGVG